MLLMVTIERATAGDLPAVEALLRASGLPLDGAPDAFASGVVARDGGRIVGCAAVELYGEAALLRSVAVETSRRGEGLGADLVAAAEALARNAGAREAYLLTETAAAWFPRFGYAPIERAAAALRSAHRSSSPAPARKRAQRSAARSTDPRWTDFAAPAARA